MFAIELPATFHTAKTRKINCLKSLKEYRTKEFFGQFLNMQPILPIQFPFLFQFAPGTFRDPLSPFFQVTLSEWVRRNILRRFAKQGLWEVHKENPIIKISLMFRLGYLLAREIWPAEISDLYNDIALVPSPNYKHETDVKIEGN